MTPFVYFNHVKYTLGFWTEKNSHIRRKQDIPYSCPCKTLYDLTLCSDRSKLLHFTTANNQIPGKSSACDLHQPAQPITDKTWQVTQGAAWPKLCSCLPFSWQYAVPAGAGTEMSSSPQTTLRSSLILLSFKNTEIWGLPPPSRWQSINPQDPSSGEVGEKEGEIRRRKEGLQAKQPEAGAGRPLPPHSEQPASPCNALCARLGPLLCADEELQGQGPTENPGSPRFHSLCLDCH